MFLSRHRVNSSGVWARDGRLLPEGFTLAFLLELPRKQAFEMLASLPVAGDAPEPRLAPIEPGQEVWASGVTYLRSRDARKAESRSSSVYDKVYMAERPELFFKANGWRVIGDGAAISVRSDAEWSVPEPELTLVVNRHGEAIGYVAGNDVSSRDIEGENPLYLPQAKVYDGSCALGPGIELLEPSGFEDLPVALEIKRAGEVVFQAEIDTSQMKRRPHELVEYLFRELEFPHGVFLMTGTGIVPPDEFTLHDGDEVEVRVGDLRLLNNVRSRQPRPAFAF